MASPAMDRPSLKRLSEDWCELGFRLSSFVNTSALRREARDFDITRCALTATLKRKPREGCRLSDLRDRYIFWDSRRLSHPRRHGHLSFLEASSRRAECAV